MNEGGIFFCLAGETDPLYLSLAMSVTLWFGLSWTMPFELSN